MMNKLLIATGNKHKLEEIRRILQDTEIQVICGSDIGIVLPEVPETGDTFEENALLKAESACKESGLPALADDSGLCVDDLDGDPGVRSARYSGCEDPSEQDAQNVNKLLCELWGLITIERTAEFVCVICIAYPDGSHEFFKGVCRGSILHAPTGNGGFGYDPIFSTDGQKSFAELTDSEKDKISHRGKALRAMRDSLACNNPTSNIQNLKSNSRGKLYDK
jgi:XTP/dITP diphosphohydrolase